MFKKRISTETISLVFILIIGFLLRIWNLDYLTLWTDEHMHVHGAKQFLEHGNFEGLIDKNGILYTFSVMPFYLIFGYADFWARFPAVLYGIGSIYMIYKLGKQLFSVNIGLFSALLLSVSTYEVFWSRLARNYSIFVFFALLSSYFFIKLFLFYKTIDSEGSFFKKSKINLRTLVFFILSFLGALLSHQLAFFLLFGWLTFLTIYGIQYLIRKDKSEPKLTKFTLFILPTILLYSILFITPVTNLFKPVLGILLQEQTIDWFLPNWDLLAKLWKEKPYFSFNIYKNVILTDQPYLVYFGLAGFALAIWKYRMKGVFILSMFLPFVLLMSFIFREPFLPRYLVEAYCYYLLSISVAIHIILEFLFTKIKSIKTHQIINISVLIGLLFLGRGINSMEFINTKKHGRIIPQELSKWTFANWKEPFIRIKKHLQPNDIILTTHTTNTQHYLNKKENIYWFRQKKLDPKTRKYVPFIDQEVRSSKGHGNSLQGIQNLYNQHDRGWVLADYYFYNVLTDPAARHFVYQNFNYHYDLGNESIIVFSWDKTKPHLKQKNKIVEELGRGQRVYSDSYQLNLGNISNKESVTLWLDIEGLDFSQELTLIFNNKKGFYSNITNRPNPELPSTKRQIYWVEIPTAQLKPNGNNLVFNYNSKVKNERKKGVIIYNLGIKNE
jgi:4-amino-4-deoxy-L-arabinose transferase-like glycosyltransferase